MKVIQVVNNFLYHLLNLHKNLNFELPENLRNEKIVFFVISPALPGCQVKWSVLGDIQVSKKKIVS